MKALFLFACLWASYSWAVTTIHPQTSFLRVESSIYHPKINKQNNRIAFTSKTGMGLTISSLKTGESFRITDHKVDASFFWAPDGSRLFYREIYLKDGKAQSSIQAFDFYLKKNVAVSEIDGLSSSLTLDPRDHRFHLLTKSGIRTHKLEYPTERISLWQRSQKTKLGYWIVTDRNIFWITNRGITMRRVNIRPESIQSYSVSPDRRSIMVGCRAKDFH